MQQEPTQIEPMNTQVKTRFIVNAVLEAGKASIKSIELFCSKFRTRTSFGSGRTAEEVFSREFSEFLTSSYAKLSMRKEVHSLSTQDLQLPGVQFLNAHFNAAPGFDGTLHVMARFSVGQGSIVNLICEDLGIIDSGMMPIDIVALGVLEDIALPLLDVCETFQGEISLSETSLIKIARKLANNSHEIRFRIELVKRFAEQQAKNPEPCMGMTVKPRKNVSTRYRANPALDVVQSLQANGDVAHVG